MRDHNTYFFFSSRRRHTRWPRDWSSDVCSSDLPSAISDSPKTFAFLITCLIYILKSSDNASLNETRSEERRVGKECRNRREPDHKKKKKNKLINESKKTEKKKENKETK